MKRVLVFLAGAAAGYLGARALVEPAREQEVHVHVRVVLDGETIAETVRRESLRSIAETVKRDRRRGGGFGFQG